LGASLPLAAAAQPEISYGAIADGSNGRAWGDDSGEKSADDAGRRALSFCGRSGTDCRVVASFSNTCAAVAVDDVTSATFAVTNAKRGIAESQALSTCKQKKGTGCRVAASICALP
jgi:hypothetical protein